MPRPPDERVRLFPAVLHDAAKLHYTQIDIHGAAGSGDVRLWGGGTSSPPEVPANGCTHARRPLGKHVAAHTCKSGPTLGALREKLDLCMVQRSQAMRA
ncbi:hypothetical protein GCM10022416_29400 [Actinomadura keratinilytica]|uniref:Uncharacterized protein n=1 Tax=Actinomadura keratinilytica TaxID=547461 RepID=A0ABP7YUE5_9ACTN